MEGSMKSPRCFPPPSRAAILHGADARRSPVLYRVKPLEYEPAVPCNCQPKAAQFISWSDDNPGMRFLVCKLAKELLVDLREKVRDLQQKNYELYWQSFWGIADAEDALADAEEEASRKEKEVTALKAENCMLKERNRQERMWFGAFGAAMLVVYVENWAI